MAHAHTFTFYTVDDTVNVGTTGTDVAIDSNGHTGICYFDDTNDALKYAYYDGDEWQTETVERKNRKIIGPHCAIIFDNNDAPNIVYYNVTDEKLRHAFKQNDNWSFKNIDTQLSLDVNIIFLPKDYHRLSIDKDSNGNFGVAYYDATNRDLNFATFNGNNWSKEVVVEDSDVGRFASIAYTSEDNPAIAFQDYTDANNASLKYMEYNGQDWMNVEVVNDNNYSGDYNTLKFDNNDVPYIVYRHINNLGTESLLLSSGTENGWGQARTLASYSSGLAGESDIGNFAEATLDGNGNIFTTYREFNASALIANTAFVRLTSYYFPDLSNILLRSVSQNISHTVGGENTYSGTSIALQNNTMAISYVSQDILKATIISTWSPAISLLTPDNESNEATNTFTLTWRDFDLDSNATIRFYYRDDNWVDTQIENEVNEDDPDTLQIDTSQIPRGTYTIVAKISDDNFATSWDTTAPHSLTILNRSPSQVELSSPPNNATIHSGTPTFTINNATDGDSDTLTYIFQIYSDENLSDLVDSEFDIEEGNNQTSFIIDTILADNTTYYWRVRATDSQGDSGPWSATYGFSTDINDTPETPKIVYESVSTSDSKPTLTIKNSTDADGDPLTYTFQLCEDTACSQLINEENSNEGLDGNTNHVCSVELESGTYYWRTRATDSDNVSSQWSSIGTLIIDLNGSQGGSDIQGGNGSNDNGGNDNGGNDNGGSAGSREGSTITSDSGGSGGGCQLVHAKPTRQISQNASLQAILLILFTSFLLVIRCILLTYPSQSISISQKDRLNMSID